MIFISSSVCAQQPHWYVLLEPGNDRWYLGQGNHDFHEVVTGYQGSYSVVERTHYYNDQVVDTSEELWLMEADGDVWHGNNCYIDMPLEVGKSWGRVWGEWDEYYDRFTVIGWDDIWGQNCVLIRERTNNPDVSVEIVTSRWYADGIGLVHWEMSCFLCSFHLDQVTVQTESKTWGEMKALFRH